MPGPSTRRLLIDLSPLRQRDYRRLWLGELVSFFGSQMTVVAVPVQVYDLTRSSLQVGLVSLAQLIPLLAGSLAGGAVIDAVDRRRILVVTHALLGAASLALAVNAHGGGRHLWPLYAVTAAAAALGGLDRPARTAAIPDLVERAALTQALALWQVLIQLGTVVGPAAAGLLLARSGLSTAYLIDAATFAVALFMVIRLEPLPPAGGGTPVSLRSVADGLRYLRGDRLMRSTFVIDLDAMIFGLPRAVFPALALRVFRKGTSGVGLLFAAPGAGALIGAVLTGWVGGVRRHGRAVIVAVIAWGASIALIGVVHSFVAVLALLAVAGAADMISALFRNTILQATVPDELRGRMSAVHIGVVTGGPRLGDAETGVAAAAFGPQAAVWTGGVACVVGALVVAWRIPELRRYDAGQGRTRGPGSSSAGRPGARLHERMKGVSDRIEIAEATDATAELADAFARLIPQLSRSSLPPARADIQAMIDAPATTIFVARVAGTIVGTLTLAVFRIPTGLRAWIEDVVVDEEATGRGAGAALTEAALARAYEAGCKTVELTSRPSREAANRLYQRLGFERRETNVYRHTLGAA